MSQSESPISVWLARLRQHLLEERYSRDVARNYPHAARCFLRDLQRRGQALESVSPADVERYLDGLKRRRDRRALPASWRRAHRAAIQMLLRLVHGTWPPEITPTTADEIALHEVVCDYDAWMVELRGLSASTRTRAARHYSSAMAARSRQERCPAVRRRPRRYIASRGISMRRSSRWRWSVRCAACCAICMAAAGCPWIADAIEGLRSMPWKASSTIRREDIERAPKLPLRRSPLGRRDYAILMLLSTYGLRGGES